MVDYRYVLQGLRGLSRSGHVNAMAGHLGAAVVAGYLFSEDHVRLPDEIHSAVQAELDRILRGQEAIWFNEKQAGVTIPELFEPFPGDELQEDRIDTIAQALDGNIASLHQSSADCITSSTTPPAWSNSPFSAARRLPKKVCRPITITCVCSVNSPTWKTKSAPSPKRGSILEPQPTGAGKTSAATRPCSPTASKHSTGSLR